jgi:hypothetical protein
MKIDETHYTSFQNAHFLHVLTMFCNFPIIFFSEKNRWNQLNNWKKSSLKLSSATKTQQLLQVLSIVSKQKAKIK